MWHWIITALNTYGLHPLHGNGYQWWSGEGSDLGEYSVAGAIVAALVHHNCHQRGCWRLGHSHPEHGWPSCKKHWNVAPTHIAQADDGGE